MPREEGSVTTGCGARAAGGRALLLAPSQGLGGGIERYVQTVEWAFRSQRIEYQRIDTARRGPATKSQAMAYAQLMADAYTALRSWSGPVHLVVAHRSLLPAASALARAKSVCCMSALCYGIDVWGPERGLRAHIESRLFRRPGVRAIAISNFTAGAAARLAPAGILPPGLSQEWFQTLVECAAISQRRRGIHIVTAFRLADWRDKGLPELLAAIASLDNTDIRLTVCGSGEPSADLQQAVRKHAWCTLRNELTDRELAAEFATADLVTLSTRTRVGREPYGEGFGLVLLEAQVAGTPVIGPAYGGSLEAYVDGITGATPLDESAEALAAVLRELLADRQRLEQMGKHAAEWSRERFAPQRYARLAVDKLLCPAVASRA